MSYHKNLSIPFGYESEFAYESGVNELQLQDKLCRSSQYSCEFDCDSCLFCGENIKEFRNWHNEKLTDVGVY